MIPGTKNEERTKGLDTLAKRAKEYYEMGCRFAKWRAVLHISEADHLPSDKAIRENAYDLARYASICQENGLCPIVEPEILSDGPHSIEVCQKVTEKVLSACFKELEDYGVYLEGILLKPNMVTPGSAFKDADKITPQEVAFRTVLAFSRTIPPCVPGVVV